MEEKTKIRIVKIIAWIVYIAVIFFGVGMAAEKDQMAGYWIGFITYAITTFVLPVAWKGKL